MTNSADFNNIPETALAWIKEGRAVALASVVETWGSAPRPVGAQLAVAADGQMAGSVSGGCVEGDVVVAAQDALEDGRARLLDYGVSDENAFAVGLACGGRIRVLVEPIGLGQGPDVEMLETLCRQRAARQPVAWMVNVDTWERRLGQPGGDPLGAALDARFQSNASGLEGAWFVAIHNPPLRLFVVGAVHIAQALLPMARMAGYQTRLIDPRGAFARAARFPGEEICEDWPDEALADAGLDAHAAVVTLSHDPKIDDPAIIEALKSDIFYLGCLGSTRTHAKRLTRLGAVGLSAPELARIHAPVGLDIGARSPAEIALSILAEITACRRQTAARIAALAKDRAG